MEGVVGHFVNHTLALTPVKDRYVTVGTTEVVFVTVEPHYAMRGGDAVKATRTRTRRLHFTSDSLRSMALAFKEMADEHDRLLNPTLRPEGTVAVEDAVEAQRAAKDENEKTAEDENS
jgi:hypothetical protein